MKKRSQLVIVLLAIAVTVSVTSATEYLGWADEFLSARVGYWRYDIFEDWSVYHNWAALQSAEPPTWSYVGQQGANATGRANAREEIMFSYRDTSTTNCGTASATLARYRTTTPPAVGSACTVTLPVVGSVTQTFDSCGFNVADRLWQNRLLPVYSFYQETAGAGTTIGYRSIVTETVGANNTVKEGCFKIKWI